MKKLSQLLQYWMTSLTAHILELLPLWLAYGIAHFMGYGFYFLLGKRRRIAMENLDIAYGEQISRKRKKKIVHEMFQNTAFSIMELYLIEKMKKKAAKRFEFKGEEHFDQAFAKGKGVILVSSHMGSWEFLSFLLYLKEKRCSVVVKEIRNPYIDREIERLRRTIDLNPIGKVNTMRQILKELHANNVVAVLIDQWAGSEGVWIDFFGKKTSTISIPARLAKKTGSILVPAFCIRRRIGHYQVKIKPAIEAKEEDTEESLTLKLNQVLEEAILENPGQWSWGHRRWKAKPSKHRGRKEDAAV